jgi:hypothetical protein
MLQLASKNIKFLALSSLLWLLIGCSSSKKAPQPQKEPEDKISSHLFESKPAVTVPPLDEPHASDFGLLKEGQTVRVGELDNAARVLFPKPKGATTTNDTPPIQSENLRSEGWETDDQYFSMLTQRGKVAFAIWSKSNMSDPEFNTLVAEYERQFSPPAKGAQIFGKNSTYRFWAHQTSRLMICSARDSKGVLTVSVAIGYHEILDALRMSPAFAERDVDLAERLRSRVKQEAIPSK